MIVIDDLSFRYEGGRDPEWVLTNAELEMESEGVTALVGVSGVGKSTLLALLAGMFITGDKMVGSLLGRILIDDLSPDQLRGVGTVSWMPQESTLLNHLTLAQNIALPFVLNGSSDCALVTDLLRKLDLLEKAECRPRELSGGQKTRVSLARALMGRPRYLFLDEPFTGLDLGNRKKVYRLLLEQRRSNEVVTLIATHDLPEAVLLADRLIVIEKHHSRTCMKVYSNDVISIEDGFDVALVEARTRAATLESRIFGETV